MKLKTCIFLCSLLQSFNIGLINREELYEKKDKKFNEYDKYIAF